MGRARASAAKQPRTITKARERVEQWRRTREKRSPMPETLWSIAVQLARKHGVYRISQDLGVNYDTLKARLTRSPEGASARPVKRSGKWSARAPRFVELKTAAPAVGAGVAFDAGGVVVVVEDGLGGRLSIRLGSQVRIEEVCALVAAFRDHAGAVGRR